MLGSDREKFNAFRSRLSVLWDKARRACTAREDEVVRFGTPITSVADTYVVAALPLFHGFDGTHVLVSVVKGVPVTWYQSAKAAVSVAAEKLAGKKLPGYGTLVAWQVRDHHNIRRPRETYACGELVDIDAVQSHYGGARYGHWYRRVRVRDEKGTVIEKEIRDVLVVPNRAYVARVNAMVKKMDRVHADLELLKDGLGGALSYHATPDEIDAALGRKPGGKLLKKSSRKKKS